MLLCSSPLVAGGERRSHFWSRERIGSSRRHAAVFRGWTRLPFHHAIKAGLRILGDREKIRNMAFSEQPVIVVKAESRTGDNPPVPPLTPQQRRILLLLHSGDLIWEMAEDPDHCTVYNEKRGRDQRLTTVLVTALEQQGWIRRRPTPQAGRLDSWELTPSGRARTTVP